MACPERLAGISTETISRQEIAGISPIDSGSEDKENPLGKIVYKSRFI
jgi:hypothetical protein